MPRAILPALSRHSVSGDRDVPRIAPGERGFVAHLSCGDRGDGGVGVASRGCGFGCDEGGTCDGANRWHAPGDGCGGAFRDGWSVRCSFQAICARPISGVVVRGACTTVTGAACPLIAIVAYIGMVSVPSVVGCGPANAPEFHEVPCGVLVYPMASASADCGGGWCRHAQSPLACLPPARSGVAGAARCRYGLIAEAGSRDVRGEATCGVDWCVIRRPKGGAGGAEPGTVVGGACLRRPGGHC